MKNQLAIVTGGSGLLGTESVISLLDLGYKVLNLDTSKSSLESSLLEYESCDISDSTQVSKVLARYSKDNVFTILVNCAFLDDKVSPMNQFKPAKYLEFDMENFKSSFNVGILGTLNIAYQVAEYMIRQRANDASIVFFGSDLSVISPDQRVYLNEENVQTFVKSVNYTVLKHAIIGATKHLSTLLAPFNIRVNSISPGPVNASQPEFLKRNLQTRIPMGRLLQKEEIRGSIKYLCSRDSSFVTGQNFVIDGGRSVW